MSRLHPLKRPAQALALITALALALAEAALLFAPSDMVLALDDTQRQIGRKSDHITANFNARSDLPKPLLRDLRFRANDAPWQSHGRVSPRLGNGHVLMEIHADDLVLGKNRLEVEFRSLLGFRRVIAHPFQYRDDMPDFPITTDWETAPSEVQDGFWEVIQSDDFGYAIRPKVGHEGYDRFVLIAPPFEGSRRITVDMRFTRATGEMHGFGVLPFWGGHIDPEGRYPRRGWEYGIAWYYSVKGGFGAEFSRKTGGTPHATDRAYRPHTPTPGEVVRIVVEARDTKGIKSIRLRIRPLPNGEFGDWIALTDHSGHLQGSRYAVGLIAHRAQVEFGAATVERIGDDAMLE